MTINEVNITLGKIFAYDLGCTDSGVNCDLLRNQLKGTLENMDENTLRITLSKYIRDSFLTDEAISQGYGIEDVKKFIEWLDESMDIYV